MELLLKRLSLNDNSTEGELFVNDTFFCYTIEDKVRAKPGEWKPNLKVYEKTAIPYGRYPVLVTWSNRFKRMLTGIFNVPDFEGIRIHNGSSELSSAGCIIISYQKDDGLNGKNNKIVNDKKAMNDLCKLIDSIQKKEKIYLTIK
jgi:Family of unknown function (DUF5675)